MPMGVVIKCCAAIAAERADEAISAAGAASPRLLGHPASSRGKATATRKVDNEEKALNPPDVGPAIAGIGV